MRSIYERHPTHTGMTRRDKGDFPHGDDRLFWYDPSLCPALLDTHFQGVRREIKHELATDECFRYLDFTRELERGPVQHGCHVLLDTSFPHRLPLGIAKDIRRILDEEVIHGDVAENLTDHVAAHTKREPPVFPKHHFMGELEKILAGVPAELRPYLSVLAVILSETLITVSLRELPHTTAPVQPAMSLFAKQHATDESLHRAVFKRVLGWLWPILPAEAKATLRPLIPRLLHAYLRIDPAVYAAMFERHRDHLVSRRPEDVVQGLEIHTLTMARIRNSVHSTVEIFDETQILSEPGMREEFERYQLL